MKYGFFFTTLFCSIFTFSGFVNAAASPLMLKQENNNISVYQGTQKIDTLTTRGNTTQECNIESTSVCIGYGVVKASGSFGMVMRWTVYPDIENAGPSVFVYDFSKKKGQLKDVTKLLYKKYGFDETLNFHLFENQNGSFTLEAFISDERGISVKQAKAKGFVFDGKNRFIGDNARLIIPASFFSAPLKK